MVREYSPRTGPLSQVRAEPLGGYGLGIIITGWKPVWGEVARHPGPGGRDELTSRVGFPEYGLWSLSGRGPGPVEART